MRKSFIGLLIVISTLVPVALSNPVYGALDGMIDFNNNSYISGDINNDGIVDEFDVVALSEYFSGINYAINRKAANIIVDNNIDRRDEVALKNLLKSKYVSTDNFSTYTGDGIWDMVWSAQILSNGVYSVMTGTTSDKTLYNSVTWGGSSYDSSSVNGTLMTVSGTTADGTVRTFTAPRSGIVKVKAEGKVRERNGIAMQVKLVNTSTDEEIWSSVIREWSEVSQPEKIIPVSAGDNISFIVTKADSSQNTQGRIEWTNVVEYVTDKELSLNVQKINNDYIVEVTPVNCDNGMLIAALYNNGILVDLKMAPYTGTQVNFNFDNTEIDTIKVVQWDSITTMKPQCNAVLYSN